VHKVYKTDIFGGRMSGAQAQAGRSMKDRMFSLANTGEAQFQNSTVDAEDMALKTWILWKDGPLMKDGTQPTIECEIHQGQSRTQAGKGVIQLHGQCPFCLMHLDDDNVFLVDEENKSLTVEPVPYSKLPRNHHMVQQWDAYVQRRFARRARPDDTLFLVSSPERWMCDYCKGWCVRVTDSVAVNDHSGAHIMYVDLKGKSR